MRPFVCGLLFACLLGGAARGGGIVSLNLCADDFLMVLAPEKVAALTMLARDPSLSVVAAAAARTPRVRADAEAVLALHPDLVLAAPWGAQAVLAALDAQGVRIERIRLPETFADIRTETRRIGTMLGEPARAEAALAEMDRVLAGLPLPGSGPRALFLEPRGWTAGPGTLAQAVLAAAGDRPAGDGQAWSLERVVAARPDMLVVPIAEKFPSLATDLLRHPALRGIPVRSVPPALLACGGPWTALAAALVAGSAVAR